MRKTFSSATPTAAIVGQSSGRVFRLGQRVHVLLDRIDRPRPRRLQFALIPSATPQGECTEKPAQAQVWSGRQSRTPQPYPHRQTRPGAKPGKTASKGP